MPQKSKDYAITLEQELAEIVAALGGRTDGRNAMCHCPAHEDRTPSLSIRIGERQLLYKCFAGCDIASVMRALPRCAASRERPVLREKIASARSDRGKGAARAVWAMARPIRGTPAAAYLASRGIPILSSALRYHPHVPLGRGALAVFRPALIAAVSDCHGIQAIERSFLARGGVGLAKDLPAPKRMLGVPGAGAVLLCPAGAMLGLAEGTESALSAMRRFGLPVWATLGAERFASIDIPDAVRLLALFPDDDAAGRLAESRARTAYDRPWRRIVTFWTPAGVNDWNDLSQQERRGREEIWRSG